MYGVISTCFQIVNHMLKKDELIMFLLFKFQPVICVDHRDRLCKTSYGIEAFLTTLVD